MITNIMIKKLLKALIVLIVLCTTIANAVVAQNAAAYQAQYTNPAILRILRLDKTVRDKGAIVGTLTAQDLTRLPIGIMDPSGKVLICIDSAKFTPNGATFSAYAAVQLPGMKEKLCFKATNIPFGPNGITSANAPALTLVSTHVLQMGQKVDLVIPGTGGNNLQWDCNGFKEVNIEGKFVFKDGFFMVDKVEAPNDTTVTASVAFQHITNINNMMASVSITPFKIRGMEDFAFKITDATVDMSDHNNPANFTFPSVYQNEFGSNINLWRGFYLRNLNVRLPFNKNNGQASMSATNMLIDENGVTGIFAAGNLIDITQGNANGWPISVDTLQVELLRNKLTGGSLAGGMKIPFLGDDSLGYKASISQWNDETQYLFQLGLREDKVFNTPFKTHVKLSAGSYVQIEKYGDTLEPSAFLQGYMSSRSESFPDPDNSEATQNVKSVKFSGLKFEHVSLSTNAPYVHSGTFALSSTISTPSLAGFKISLSDIKFVLGGGQAKLDFKASLNFMDSGTQAFAASAGFIYAAEFKQETTPFKKLYWQSKGLAISSIALNVNTGTFKLQGGIDIYRNDSVYGNGFRGGVSMHILPGKLDLLAAAQVYFGNKDGLRYWQASGYASSSTFGVPLIPGVVDLNGFLGGISWHMKKQSVSLLSLPVMLDTAKNAMPTPDASAWARQVYQPDVNSGLGIMIGVNFKAPGATVPAPPPPPPGSTNSLLTGSVALEVGFNNNWGLSFVELRGMVTMFKDIASIDPKKVANKDLSNDAAFRGEICMLYDVPNKTFHANIAAYLNLQGQVVGAGPQNKVGELVIHASPSNWYIYVGRPSSPLGVKIPLKAVEANVQAYFMVGSQLEPFPTPPNEIMQNISYTPMVSADNLKQGKGVAFGARFSTSFGFGMEPNSKSWIYGGFAVGAGADVMLSTSGNYTCGGEAVGFDGWWARGQAYVYIQGKIGIRVKVMGNKRSFDIANLSAGLLLEAKIPKPSWFRGFGYVQYNILGGLIKGKANFKVQLGEECQVSSNNDNREIETKVIAGTYPASGQSGMELYSLQAITTNTPINTPFDQMDDNGSVVRYRCYLQSFTLKKNGVNIAGNISFEDGNKKIFFKSNKMLDAGSSYVVDARFAYTKEISPNNWTIITESDGSLAVEDTSFTFVTGPPSSTIGMHNINYAYPFSDMQNFYKNEYTQGGYIDVDNSVNFDNVFAPGADASGNPMFDYKVKIKSVSPNTTESYLQPFTIHNRTIKFAMPSGLQNSKVYRLSLVRINLNANVTNNQSNNQTSNQLNNTDSSGQTYYSDTIVNNVLSGPVTTNEAEMFSYNFRVSKYATFAEKVASMANTSENMQDMAVGNVLLIGANKNTSGELFDDFELKPLTTSLTIDGDPIVAVDNATYASGFPMIKVRADSANTWMQQDIYPRVYPSPVYGESSFYSDTVLRQVRGLDEIPPSLNCINVFGNASEIVPLDKVTIEHNFVKMPHNDAHERLSQVATDAANASKLIIKYNVPYFASLDYQKMYFVGVCNWIRANNPARTPGYTNIVNSGGVFPQIRSGSYKIYLNYTLPGNIQKSTASLSIDY
jgi:hypothetical protein